MLKEISQIDKHCKISLIFGILKKKNEFMDTENRLLVARSRGWEKRQDKWMKGIKKFKFSVLK